MAPLWESRRPWCGSQPPHSKPVTIIGSYHGSAFIYYYSIYPVFYAAECNRNPRGEVECYLLCLPPGTMEKFMADRHIAKWRHCRHRGLPSKLLRSILVTRCRYIVAWSRQKRGIIKQSHQKKLANGFTSRVTTKCHVRSTPTRVGLELPTRVANQGRGVK